MATFEDLIEFHLEALKGIEGRARRASYDEIDWQARLVGIVGARGVGKTTLLLQYYLANFSTPEKCLYLSADNLKVASLGLFDIARDFFRMDGRALLIDEIHKYPNWSQELKNIYDTFPKAKLVISGSSTLDILKGRGDLSRRVVLYRLRGLSFREYLAFKAGRNYPIQTLDKILKEHVPIAKEVVSEMRVLKHFQDYLKGGYYPYFLEGTRSYFVKLENVIEKVIYEDIPAVFDVRPSSVPYLKKLLYLVATSQPFIPNIEKISAQIGLSKEYVYNFFDYLEKAGLFAFLYPDLQGLKLARKPQKIYMENPNLIYAIVGLTGFRAEIGAARESFFLNQVRARHAVHASAIGDFAVTGGLTFEVGGKGKDGSQLKLSAHGYIAADQIEIGVKNKIPLWLFGFLY